MQMNCPAKLAYITVIKTVMIIFSILIKHEYHLSMLVFLMIYTNQLPSIL